MRHPARLAAFLWLAAVATGSLLAAEGATATVGEVRLGSGLTARYVYHYDRNALAASRLAGDALVALTRSGGLLRFDRETLGLDREWFGPVPATCLGRGEGDSVLVGFGDGRVRRVDPATLALADVAALPGKVRWVGWSPGGLVAVTEREESRDRGHGMRWPVSVVHDLASGKTYAIERKSRDPRSGQDVAIGLRATAFLLDAGRRLWLGGDHGEWGGWCSCVDLAAGRVRDVAGIKDFPDRDAGWDGVYGFHERPDGRVWAHGGTMHMGGTEGFIRRVDGPEAEPLYRFSNFEAREGLNLKEGEAAPEPGKPYLPITHVLDGPGDGLTVFAYSLIDRADAGLKRWTREQVLDIHYRAGRPDAVGVYPSIVAVHRLGGPGERLLCATAVDGYVSLDDGKAAGHALPGQIGIEDVRRIANTAEGTLFLPGSEGEPAWRLGPDGWKVADLAPPFERAPDDPRVEKRGPGSWSETRVMVGPGGAVFTVSGDGRSPGTRTTARRRDGESEVLGRETSSLDPSGCFVTPDGGLWNAAPGDLRRLIDGRWTDLADLPGADPAGPPAAPPVGAFARRGGVPDVGLGLVALNDAGPPWVLLDRDGKQLLRLDYGPGFKAPRLDAARIIEGGDALAVLDAIPRADGEWLLATSGGLRLFDVARGATRPAPLPVPDRPVAALARDGLGRTWLAGDGLRLVDPDGRRLHDLGATPMLGRTPVAAIAPDPSHRDGVIAALGPRGVVFVRVPPGP